MGHFEPGKTRFENTPPEWLETGRQFGKLVNGWADRDDIISYVGKGAGAGISVACFRPDIAEMEIAVDQAFGEHVNPAHLPDFSDRDAQFDYPQVMGAILHESMHARHSLFDLEELHKLRDKRVIDLVTWLEETRIEARGVARFPENRSFLRACALKFALESLADPDAREKFMARGALSISQLILLSLARVDAGVLEAYDVEVVREMSEEFFGADLLGKLRGVWLAAHDHRADDQYAPLVTLAEEWLKLLEESGHKTEPEKLSQEEQDALEKFLKAMAGAMAEAEEETADAAADEAVDQAIQEMREQAAETANAGARDRQEAKDQAAKVFGRGSGPSECRATSSKLIERRDPTDEERGAAVKVAKLLERAKYRDRVVVPARSTLPPGRLSGRAALQRDVQRGRGQMVTAEPWTHKRRLHTEDPELRVGVMVDISGSMNSAMVPMAVTAWMLSEAVRRVQGRAASIYYGNGVFPVLKPGERQQQVNVYSAEDGTERFNEAFLAIDGVLDLLNSSGARLLVIASDMCYGGSGQYEGLERTLKRCDQAGVATVCLPFTTRGYVDRATAGTRCKVVDGAMSPAAVALEIGTAAAKALEEAGGRG